MKTINKKLEIYKSQILRDLDLLTKILELKMWCLANNLGGK